MSASHAGRTVVIIPARFASERLPGKPLMEIAGKPLIQHVLEGVEGLGDDLLVTTQRPQDYAFLGIRLVRDRLPGAGPLSGLHSALENARYNTLLLVGCDMPFLCRPLLAHLLSLSPLADVVIPQPGGLYEPLHAVYRRTCLPPVERAIASGEKRMISFFPHVKVQPLGREELERFDPQGRSFFNINTVQDLAIATAILRQEEA